MAARELGRNMTQLSGCMRLHAHCVAIGKQEAAAAFATDMHYATSMTVPDTCSFWILPTRAILKRGGTECTSCGGQAVHLTLCSRIPQRGREHPHLHTCEGPASNPGKL